MPAPAAATDQSLLRRRMGALAGGVERVLSELLADDASEGEPARPALLMQAMRHGVLGGGKRFRPFLVAETARLFGRTGGGPLRAGAALELVHCYSLVHDDLPAMDDDDLRRGRPTVHKAYDEALAILAGDALLTLAFEVMADRRMAASPATRVALVRVLARAAGAAGMVGGQVLDLAAEGRYPASQGADTADAVRRIQRMKTGALIEAAATIGALVGGAQPRERKAVEHYARALGLAFQIRDDLLDAEGSAESVGKRTGKDAAAGKATFVSLAGPEGARARLDEVTAEARAALAPFGRRALMLEALLDFNGRRES